MQSSMPVTDRRRPTPARPSHRNDQRLKAALRLLLRRGCPPGSARTISLIATAASIAGAGLVASTAVIHLHLWLAGYREVPRLGPLFLAQAIVGLVLAPILAVGRQLGLVILAAIYMAASALGLILSATVGFLGIHEGLDVPWATPALVVELVGFVLLGATATLRTFQAVRHSRRRAPAS
jgi:hypothetical protein